MEKFHVTGTLVWYYHICPREAWFMARQIVPDEDDPNIDYGRFLQEKVYQREKKEITIGHLKLDIMKSNSGKLVIGEIKKSSASKESARMQLLFYLYELKQMGIEAVGELLFPEERRKEKIELDQQAIEEVESLKKKIMEVVNQVFPPPAKKVRWCRNCAYNEMCWA
ncbi:CRISPR-associated protein Cas4 [Effusibacillus lacus]|uniref:CRISPR-associated exonuclease Cas4 n=1 Tax=Effusibacillus lacus TaxID=1348429 RepID=A0A292YP63_9BACL|nr:CRISPR-associated protein Cas4 [Effusibacillus lacus]TCS68782.1 CRISPR-associated exonuclease Cas4 [Effusibacillus lacus]GAX90699.1 CRISPR-associated protein Cas4 [Effusibacillus lacus]